MDQEQTISPAEAFNAPAEGQQTPISQEPTGTPGFSEGAAPQQQPVQAPAPTPSITPEMIQAAVQAGASAAIRAHQPSQPPPQRRDMTPEEQAEFDRTFNVVRVTPELYKGIYGVAPADAQQVKNLESFAHNVARQAIAMAVHYNRDEYQNAFKNYQQQLDARLSPVFDAYRQQEAAKLEQEFLTSNEDLKDHAALVKELAIATKAQLDQGNLRELRNPDGSVNRGAAMKFVADKARSLLNKAAPTGQNPSQVRGPSRRHSMTPLSGGGRPGTGGPQQPGNNSATFSPKEVFGDTER